MQSMCIAHYQFPNYYWLTHGK